MTDAKAYDDFSDLENWDEVAVSSTPRTRDEFDIEDDFLKTNFGNADSQNRDAVYTEDCKACRGTGRFRSYTGRIVGPCFKCNGTGQLTFKTSPEQRAKQRERAAIRKLRKQETRKRDFETWCNENSDMLEFLKKNSSWNDFYVSMLEKAEQYGGLTDGQIGAVRKGMLNQAERDATKANRPADAEVSLEGMKRLHESFDNARKSGLKYPKLTVLGIIISRAPDSGKNAGCLYVKAASADKTYLGKINANGKFFKVHACTPEYIKTLQSIAEDPLKAAQLHGLQTGNCSCCNRELTNPESVALGIGPICRSKWGF
jgi:hypothetical protein